MNPLFQQKSIILTAISYFLFISSLSAQPFTEQTDVITQIAIWQLVWGDYDNDGDLDYISIASDSTSMDDIFKVFTNDGTGNFSEQFNITSKINQATPSWADIDNDGDLDILLSGYVYQSNAELYKNNGNGNFVKMSGISIAALVNGASAWGDYDNDGDLDLIITGHTDVGNTKLYRNNGNSTFTEITSNDFTGMCYSSIDTGDYDNDGDLDLIITGSRYTDTDISKVYRNDGNLIFTEQTDIMLPGISSGKVDFGDYDNDGYLDILMAGEGICKIYKNDGDGGFIEQNEIELTGIYNGSASWGDYNNDSYLDILLTGGSSSISSSEAVTKIYQNNGEGDFIEQTDLLSSEFAGNSDLIDYDGDGDLDIVTCFSFWNIKYQKSKVYCNNRINSSTSNMTLLKDNFIKVYPNPSKGVININSIDKDAKIEVYNLFGEKIIKQIIYNGKDSQIDLSGKQKGIYLLRINTGEIFENFKIILE